MFLSPTLTLDMIYPTRELKQNGKRIFIFFRPTAKDDPGFEGLERDDGKGGDKHSHFYCTIMYAKVKENKKLNRTEICLSRLDYI